MHAILAILSFRTFFTFATIAFAIGTVMLSLNIITVQELEQILGIENTNAGMALEKIVAGLQKMMGQVLNIISQLLNKMFDWAGVDINLSKIHIDVNATPGTVPDVVEPVNNNNSTSE